VGWTIDVENHDSWQGFRTERDNILDFIETNNISGVVLLSAIVIGPEFGRSDLDYLSFVYLQWMPFIMNLNL
jgi:hypothetical protein